MSGSQIKPLALPEVDDLRVSYPNRGADVQLYLRARLRPVDITSRYRIVSAIKKGGTGPVAYFKRGPTPGKPGHQGNSDFSVAEPQKELPITGILHGVGWSVMEELRRDNGRVLALHLGDYRVPSIKDIPELTTVLLQEPGGPTPYQGKAIGEVSIVPVAAAVANAVCDATGLGFFELPLSAEKIYRALREKR